MRPVSTRECKIKASNLALHVSNNDRSKELGCSAPGSSPRHLGGGKGRSFRFRMEFRYLALSKHWNQNIKVIDLFKSNTCFLEYHSYELSATCQLRPVVQNPSVLLTVVRHFDKSHSLLFVHCCLFLNG